MNDERAETMLKLLTEIRDLQKQSFDRQNRFLWISIPIFAVLCIQTTLLLVVR
jgi:hypothetical protein